MIRDNIVSVFKNSGLVQRLKHSLFTKKKMTSDACNDVNVKTSTKTL